MKKKVKLKDGTEILIREMHKKDLDKSLAFFQALPEEDREYLRVDVTKRDVLERRIRALDYGLVVRLVAEIDGNIVADGALELEGLDWKDHVAELRLIVAHDFQHRGLGKAMARELYFIAASKKVEQIVAKFMGPQVRAQSIFKKLGFHREGEIHNYVKDIHGHKQDMVVMCCDLESLWQKLDDHITDFDWGRTR